MSQIKSSRTKRRRLNGSLKQNLVLSLICCALVVAPVNSSSEGRPITSLNSQDSKLTKGLRSGKEDTWERLHVVKRVYGDENGDVRREIRRLEERIPKYETGLNGDPDHIVPYENHPYDRSVSRKTEEISVQSGGQEGDESEPVENRFQPMRIKFITAALEEVRTSQNSAKIDWFIREIQPRTADFWSAALSVVPVSGNLKISSFELDSYKYCGDVEFTEVPSSHKSTGVADADLILYVSASNSERFCPARTLAVAVPCNFDQYDRPTAGAINVCLDNIDLRSDGTSTDEVIQDYVDVTIHEVGHVLGHSSNSYRFFWDPETGQPRTSRPFSPRTVTCVDGSVRSLILPDENTMLFSETNKGLRIASIVTPKVKQIARNQFDCQDLEGGQLENQPTRADSCTGDHWDERLYYPEAMSGIISPTTNVMSSLTLALMEDSGWYQANYTNTRMSPWGLGAGCDFVRESCLVSGGLPDYSKGFFCNEAAKKGCSSEHSHKMACTVIDYYYYVPQVLPPEEYQYFSDASSKGGPRQSDYCPVYGSSYNNYESHELDCRKSENTEIVNVYNEVYGEDSKCIESSSAERGLCYRTACVRDTMSVKINVNGEWLTCESDFQKLTVYTGEGILRTELTCPRLSQACPDLFCPFNCAGRGICNYANIVNGTVRPRCECFDADDTSPACSDSLIPDGEFLEDSSGLFDNLEENFFDPVIAIFIDEPAAWTTASWAWAGGLVVIGLILVLCIGSSFFPEPQQKRQPPGRRKHPSGSRNHPSSSRKHQSSSRPSTPTRRR